MRYEYTHLIPENVAPKGATGIVIMETETDEDGNKIPVKEACSIPASRFGDLTRPAGQPIYSVGWISDGHAHRLDTTFETNRKLANALTFFKEAGCVCVFGCGDFTETGFYRKNESTSDITLDDGTVISPQGIWYDEQQMARYSGIIGSVSIPVFEIAGNHESMYKPITNDLTRLKELTGIPATSYTVSSSPDSAESSGTTVRPNRYAPVGNDLYIMCSQPNWSTPMSSDDFIWLQNTLSANKGRRCFVAVHPYMEEDSGDPLDLRENSFFDAWSKTTEYVNLLAQYDNVLTVHGHSHMKFEHQAVDSRANYATIKGYRSLHVPSLGKPRNIVGSTTPEDINSSQCYTMDVYEDCVVLNGYDLHLNGVPTVEVLGTYKIEV